MSDPTVLVNLEFPEHVKLLETWIRSYKPKELFHRDGRLLRYRYRHLETGQK